MRIKIGDRVKVQFTGYIPSGVEKYEGLTGTVVSSAIAYKYWRHRRFNDPKFISGTVWIRWDNPPRDTDIKIQRLYRGDLYKLPSQELANAYKDRG